MQEPLEAKEVMRLGLRGVREYGDYNWHGKMITVKYLLEYKEFLELLRSVENMCTSPDGELIAGLLDFSIKANVVAYYASVELPDDMDDVYKVVYCSDIYDVVLKMANKKQVDALLSYFGMAGGV